MAKAAGLSLSSKLRSVLKKMNSFGNNSSKKLSRDNSSASSSSSSTIDLSERRVQKVYVGRSRREYQVPLELLDHPVMRELVDNDDDVGSVIGCEVVLFDHLCWMLEGNAVAAGLEDVDIAAYYAY